MVVSSGEFTMGETDGVISLSKKIGLFQKLLTKFGYTNIAVHQVIFKYKSRCPAGAEGLMTLKMVDRRLDDPDDMMIDGLSFDVKDWIVFSWSYPCWFHYKDFESKEKDLLEIEWGVSGSNMIDSVSLGHYKVKIAYKMRNDITRLVSNPNIAQKVHSQVHVSKFVKKQKTGRLSKSTGNLLNVSSPPDSGMKNTKNSSDYRKEELLTVSAERLFPIRGVKP